MKNIGLLAVQFIVTVCFVLPCNEANPNTCPMLKPNFLEGFNRVMVYERFGFIREFKKLCHSFERERWLNLTQEAVCFGALDNMFASVVTPFEGFLTSLKLVHVTGQVSCDMSAPHFNSKWGCSRSHPALGRTPFNVVITAGQHKGILYPRELFLKGKKESLWYDIPDVDPDAPELVLGDLSYPYYVTFGQELRVWLGEDFQNSGKENQFGKVCFTVKGWYIF